MSFIIFFRYMIYELRSNRVYQVDMNISVCFESDDNCLFFQRVLTKAILFKKPCSLQTGFIDTSK